MARHPLPVEDDDETVSPPPPATQVRSHKVVVTTGLMGNVGMRIMWTLRNGPEKFLVNGEMYYGGYCDAEIIDLVKNVHQTTSSTVANLKLAGLVRTFKGRMARSITTGNLCDKYYVRSEIPDKKQLSRALADASEKGKLLVPSSVALRRYLTEKGKLNPVLNKKGKLKPTPPQVIAHAILDGYRLDHPVPQATPGSEQKVQAPVYEPAAEALVEALRRGNRWKNVAKRARRIHACLLAEIRAAGVPLADPKSVEDLLKAHKRAVFLKVANAVLR